MVDTLTGRRGLEDRGDEQGPSGHFLGLCCIQDKLGHNLRNCLQHHYIQLLSVSTRTLIIREFYFLIDCYQTCFKTF